MMSFRTLRAIGRGFAPACALLALVALLPPSARALCQAGAADSTPVQEVPAESAPAESAPAESAPAESRSAESTPAEPPSVPEGFESPRDTLETFFERFNGDDVAGATRALGYEGLSAEELEEVAANLKFVLDRTFFFKPYHLPGHRAARIASGSFVWSRSVEALEAKGVDERVELGFTRGEEGAWHITAPDPGELDRLRRLFVREGLEPVPGVERPQGLTLLDTIQDLVPDPLRERVFVLEIWQWAGIGILLALAVLLDLLSRGVTAFILARAAGKDHKYLDKKEVAHFARPTGLLLGSLAFRWGLGLLHLAHGPREVLNVATALVATLAAVWSAYRLVDVFCGALAKKAERTANRFDDVLVPLLRRTLKIFVVTVGLVYMASQWTDNLWRIVAGLGVGSLALGFAAKDSIENLFGTFTVLMDQPFQLGDWITMGDIDGNVEKVGFRSTRVRTFYNSLITVPNSRFIGEPVDNMGARRYRRIKTLLALTYDTPPEKVEAFCEGVRTLILNHPYTRKDYFHVYLNGLGESSLDVLLYCFVETPDWGTELREKHRLLADVLRLAERLEVQFAFPSRSLHVVRAADLEHPDRPADDTAGRDRGEAVARAILAGAAAVEGPGGGRAARGDGLQQGDEGE